MIALAGLLARGVTQANHMDRRTRYLGLEGLTDGVPVAFTHADLNLSNILLPRPPDGPFHIVAVIDCHQAG